MNNITSLNTFIREKLERNNFYFSSNTDVWCIGDVHGCAYVYERLLKRIKESTSNETVIFQLGDLVSKGNHFYPCFLFSKAYEVILLLGNHELRLYQNIIQNKVPERTRSVNCVYRQYYDLDNRQRDVVKQMIARSLTHAKVSIE